MRKKEITTKKIKRGVKGITLIALVVTIIVLLILSAVAINLSIGNNGIFKRAKDAVDKYEEASINEQKELNSVSDFLDEKTTKTVVQAYKDGELEIGDYVDYQNPENREYTSPKEKNGVADQKIITNTTTKWKVLGLSEDGNNLLLTTVEPIKINEAANPNIDNSFNEEIVTEINETKEFYMYGAEAYVYGIDELNKMSEIYKNDLAQEVRHMKIEDINNLLGIVVKYDNPNAGVYKKDDVNYKNNLSSQGTLGYNYVFKENEQTPKSSLGLENVEVGHEEQLNTYRYYYDNEDLNITDIKIINVAAGWENNDSNDYYLASTGIDAHYYADFGLSSVDGWINNGRDIVFSSNNDERYIYNLIRPVVVLKKDVTVKQLKKANTYVVRSHSYEEYSLYDTEKGEDIVANERVIVETKDGIEFDGNAEEVRSDVDDRILEVVGYYYSGYLKVTIYKDGKPYYIERIIPEGRPS